MRYILRYIVLFVSSVSLLWFGGCVTDSADLDDGASGGVYSEDDGLIFSFGATRGGFADSHNSELSKSDEEIVINPANFHVVLFSAEGDVKQVWKYQELTQITEYDESMGQDIKQYFVKIPRYDIDDGVVNYIRDNKFKIAVFANWDGYPEFTTTKEQLQNGIYKNTLFYISHCREDSSYESAGAEGEMNDLDVFGFITGKGAMMGIAQEWVAERFKSDDEADTAIRANYKINDDGTGEFVSNSKPTLTDSDGNTSVFNEMQDYTYSDVWQVWNFGGSQVVNNSTYYVSTNPDVRRKWAEINNDWYATMFNDNGTAKSYSTPVTVRGLTLNGSGSSTSSYNYGIQLPNSDRGTDGNTAINDNDGAYLHLKIPSDGYLYVKCQGVSNIWSWTNPTLVARRGKLNSTTNISTHSFTVGTNSIQTYTFGYSDADDKIVRITGEPEDVVLYATGGAVRIYEIDYIKSRTIQTVDRQMINPASTPEGGISMYGIQDFEPLGTYWPEGTSFNLSRYDNTHTGDPNNEYKYRTIYLLRSVAKVEVMVPTAIFPKPSHMYMRTINRFSRSAPLDVFTPTDIIWNGWSNDYAGKYTQSSFRDSGNNTHNYADAKGVDQEAENIRLYGFTYDPNSSVLNDYRNAVAWLFGLWAKEYGWNWNNENINIRNSNQPYPRVFNTRISRSDFAHMIDGGKTTVDGQEYYYYYAYLPEKNVTDPNDKGTLSEAPKVMRIEMRFGDRNTDANLDDNASYRIYFTPGGKGSGINSRDDYDGAMESSSGMDNLKEIYPVMRNHLYRFKIVDVEMNGLNVNFEVSGPANVNVDYTFE